MADQAAKEGANGQNITKYVPKPWCETKVLVEKLVREEWNMGWQDDPQYVHTKFFYPKVSTKKRTFAARIFKIVCPTTNPSHHRA